MAFDELTWALQLIAEPEYANVESFVEFCLDDDRIEFGAEDLAALNRHTRRPVHELRKDLEAYGLRLMARPLRIWR